MHEIKISFWRKENDKIVISLGQHTGITGITEISDNKNLERGHPHLYKQLKQILINENKWFVEGE